jgi:iron complex transport system substrate-binding protein
MKRNIEVPGFILPGVEDITRRDLLVGGAAALLIGGCGSDGGNGESSDETRTVEHALGTSEVPANPRRVACLIPGGGVDYLMTYGVVPIAAADYSAFGGGASGRPFYGDLVDFPVEASAEEIRGFGCCAGNYNLEVISAAEPDLIIGWDYQFEGAYDQLSQIAPSVGFSLTNGPDWIEAGRSIAEALGRVEQHESWLDEWRGQIESLRSEFGDPSERRVTIVNASDPASLTFITAEGTQEGSIASAAGFRMTGLPEGAGEGGEISQELIPALDAIFVTTNFFAPEDYERFLEETYGANPLWEQLEAVQNEMVFPVDTFFWTNGGPSVNTQVILPDMFAAVFEGRQPRSA